MLIENSFRYLVEFVGFLVNIVWLFEVLIFIYLRVDINFFMRKSYISLVGEY